jgi:hypothetical protein
VHLLKGDWIIYQFVYERSLPNCGPGSLVGIATGYELDGPGIKFRGGGGRGFPQLFRPALRPTQPPVHWVSGLFWG